MWEASGDAVEQALDDVARVAESYGTSFTAAARSGLGCWASAVTEWRRVAQLTAARSPEGVIRALMLPAVYACGLSALREAGTVVDLGCGSGTTGVALASVLGRGQWLLVDRSTKKVAFCRYAVAACRIRGVEALEFAKCVCGGRRGDVVLVRGLPHSDATRRAIEAVALPEARVVRWGTEEQLAHKPGALRCGTLAVWVAEEPLGCFT